MLPFILLIYGLACGQGRWASFLSTKPLIFLGGASYSIYLLQMPVRHWAHVALGGHRAADGIDTVLSPLILIAFSSLVFLCWEEPMRKWLRNRLGARPTPQVEPVAVQIRSSEAS